MYTYRFRQETGGYQNKMWNPQNSICIYTMLLMCLCERFMGNPTLQKKRWFSKTFNCEPENSKPKILTNLAQKKKNTQMLVALEIFQQKF